MTKKSQTAKENTEKKSPAFIENRRKVRQTTQKNTEKKLPLLNICLEILLLSLWTVFIIISVQFLVSFIFASLFGNFSDSPIIFTIYSLVYYALSVLIIIFSSTKIFKKQTPTRENLGLKDLPTFSDIALGPVALIIYLLLAMGLTFVFSLFPWFDATQAQDLGLNTYMNQSELFFTFLALVVIAPISEEIIFRGWLYDKIRKLIPGKKSVFISILLVSILFGLIHGQLNVAVNVFAMSVIACLLREMTGTIYAGIFLHILKNTLAFLLVYVYHLS